MKRIFFLSFLLQHTVFIIAQSISQDSRGKDVMEVYKAENLTGSFAPTQLSLSLNYNFIIGAPFYFHPTGFSARPTISISHAISVTAKITGSGTGQGKPFNFSKELVRPAYRLEIGYQRTIDMFNDIKAIPSFTYVAGGYLYGEWQSINLYDTTLGITTSKKPFTFGGHGHFTMFHKSGWFAISLSQDIGFTYNQEAFTPYQAAAGTFIDNNIVSQQAFLGNIGTYNKATSFRARVAVPVFFNEFVNITPFLNRYGYFSKNGNTVAGMTINLFNGSPRKKDGTIGKGFGIGVDWVKSKEKWTSPSYFIFGNLDLNFLKKSPKPIDNNTDKLL